MWQAVIGLECHAQLDTRTKLFCACPLEEGAAPNTTVCPICLGHPGTLPVLNAAVVHLAVKAGLALGCTINESSIFERKQYFYPDLPKGYQISQYERPICSGGAVHVEVDGELVPIRLNRIHIEEDAGKSLHTDVGTQVDYNRAGTPLVEIVSEADIRSPEQAEAYLRTLHRVLVEAGITRGDMEKGHFRCDANVSVHHPGEPWGTRAEIKNVNSFRFVAKAIAYEIQRQIELLEAGGHVVQETRTWRGNKTKSLRGKEGSSDYRYFPDPDLPPLRVIPSDIDAAGAELPATPLDLWLRAEDARRRAELRDLGLGHEASRMLLGNPEARALFDRAMAAGAEPVALASLIQGEVIRRINAGAQLASSQLEAGHLVGVLARLGDGSLSSGNARKLVELLWTDGGDVDALIEAHQLSSVGDEDGLRAIIVGLVEANPAQAERYRSGNKKMLGFFMGQVMRATSGRADPGVANRLVAEVLDAR